MGRVYDVPMFLRLISIFLVISSLASLFDMQKGYQQVQVEPPQSGIKNPGYGYYGAYDLYVPAQNFSGRQTSSANPSI